VPRRTPLLASAAALALGSLSALGVAACGEEGGSAATEALERPPLTVGSGVTLPAGGASTQRARTTTTPADTGGADDADPGGATDPGTDATVDPDPTPTDTGGGATDTDTGTDEPEEPANPGGAAPDYDEFCEENQGAC
jgi:hypothetical protein